MKVYLCKCNCFGMCEVKDLSRSSRWPAQCLHDMNGNQRKRAGQSTQASLDLISDLPKDVMDLIFVRMPIRDAIRTSVLSKKWRYKWVSMPDVVFDRDCLTEGASEIERAHIMDQVLLHHVGPICKFSCMFYVQPCSHTGRWIVFLSRSGIKKLILLVKSRDGYYDLPSSIFFCQELHHLELLNCKLKVPPTFKGFHNLLVLNLAVYTSEDDIARLISRCRLLEKLKMRVWCHHPYRCLNIHAPNLRCLELNATFEGLSLGSSPLLTNMSIYLCICYKQRRNLRQGNICSLNQLIGYSHGIGRVALHGSFLQGSTQGPLCALRLLLLAPCSLLLWLIRSGTCGGILLLWLIR